MKRASSAPQKRESGTAINEKEVVFVTDEDDETEKMPPSNEAVKPEIAAVRTYQRRPAREETSGMRSKEEPSREAPRQRAGENVDSPARSAVEIPRRRRRLLIDEEPEEQEEVFFTPIDAQPSAGQPDTSAGIKESEEERRRRKRKGKAIATPGKKKPRQASTTLVIQEGRQRAEERNEEEDEALRMERRSKRRNDGMRSRYEQRSEMAKYSLRNCMSAWTTSC